MDPAKRRLRRKRLELEEKEPRLVVQIARSRGTDREDSPKETVFSRSSKFGTIMALRVHAAIKQATLWRRGELGGHQFKFGGFHCSRSSIRSQRRVVAAIW